MSCNHAILFFEPNITTLVNIGVMCPDICAPLTDENLVSTIFPMQACATETCGDTASDLLTDLLYIPAQFTFLTYEFSSFIITEYCVVP